ncbi:MAG: hypothetical protein ACKO0Z_07795 [Betaproteobacteria bacterium]
MDKGTSRANQSDNEEGYSGSTAWHNSSRSRLFLRRNSGNQLTLTHQKFNLGQRHCPLQLQWLDGGLPTILNPDDPFEAKLRARQADELAAEFLKIMASHEDQGDFCSTQRFARNNVFSTLREDRKFKDLHIDKGHLQEILQQCVSANWIEETSYCNAYRKVLKRWSVTPLGREYAGTAGCK